MHESLTHQLMHHRLLFLLTGLIWLTGLSGCSEEVEPKPATYAQLLTGRESKAWRLTGIQLIEGEGAPVSFNIPSDCVYDDLYVFYANADNAYEIQEGASKCNPDDPDVFFEGDWALVNATATLSFVFPILFAQTVPYTIISLTATTLTVEYYFSEDDFRYRFILSAQNG